VDESLVITDDSDNVPLRVVDDGWFRGHPRQRETNGEADDAPIGNFSSN